MKKNVVLIGCENDISTMDMKGRLEVKGANVILLDSARFPYESKITFNIESPTEGFIGENSLKKIAFSDINSVYYRCFSGIRTKQEKNSLLREIVYWNIESALGSFFKCIECPCINPYNSVDMLKYKGLQLKILKQAGIKVPETIITNDSEEVIKFYEENNFEIIYKPVRGWANTEFLTKDKLTKENLKTLSNSPITLQKAIRGTDIRIYVLKDKVFALEIQSDTIDYRAQENAKRIPCKLPDYVVEECYKINKVLNLVFSGIDLKRTPEGEYVYFEANATPVFLLDEKVCNYPISNSIAELLLN